MLLAQANTAGISGELIGAIGGLMAALLGGIAAYAASQSNTRSKEWKEMQDQLQGQLSAALKEQDRLRVERNDTLDRMRIEIERLRGELQDRTFRYQKMQLVNAQLSNKVKQLEGVVGQSNPEVERFIKDLYSQE